MLMEFEIPLPTAFFTLPLKINGLFHFSTLHGNTWAQGWQSQVTASYGLSYKRNWSQMTDDGMCWECQVSSINSDIVRKCLCRHEGSKSLWRHHRFITNRTLSFEALASTVRVCEEVTVTESGCIRKAVWEKEMQMKKGGKKDRRRKCKERYLITSLCVVEQNWDIVTVTHKEK